MILGRGSFTESFPLFGYQLADYEDLFAEKLDLFVALRGQGPVTWSGRTRAGLDQQMVYPPVAQPPLKTWVGVGGSPQSVIRTARYGLPMMLAIIGGQPMAFAPYVQLFHEALTQLELPAQPVGVHSPGYVAASDEQALHELWPHYSVMMTRIGRERGWPPLTRGSVRGRRRARTDRCSSVPRTTVATKIATVARGLGLARFDLKYSHGTLAHEQLMTCIELYGTEVAPRVQTLLAKT